MQNNPYNPNSGSTPLSLGGTPDQAGVATATPAAPAESGNWFTHLLPTIGGIGGSLLGGVFTGGLGGQFVGGAGGSALGKTLENVIEGKDPVDGDVLSAGLEGGIGAGVGGVIGKGLGTAGKLVGNRAGKIVEAGAEKAAQDEALATANAVKNNYGGVKAGVQSSNKLDNNLDLLKSWGHDASDPHVMANASKGGLFINDIDEAALAAGKPVKTTDLFSAKDITKATPEEQDALIKSGIIGEDGAMTATVTPLQATKFAGELNGQVRTLEGIAENARAAGNVNDFKLATAEANAMRQKYNAVQKLAGGDDVNSVIANRTISPEEKTQLVEQFGQKQADHIEQAVNGAQTHGDLVSAKLPFAQMNEISRGALRDFQAAGTARAAARAKGDITGDGVADPVSQNPTQMVSDIKNASGPTGKAIAIGKHVANNPSILALASRMGALGEKLAPAAGAAVATSPNLAADPVATAGIPGVGGTMDQNGVMMNPSVNPQQQLTDALRAQAILAPSAAGESGATSYLASIAPQLQKNALTEASLAGVPSSFANAGGAQGTGGIFSQLTSLIPGTAANTYERQKSAAAGQLAASLGISQEQAEALLPRLMQDQAGAGISTGVLGSLSGQLIH